MMLEEDEVNFSQARLEEDHNVAAQAIPNPQGY